MYRDKPNFKENLPQKRIKNRKIMKTFYLNNKPNNHVNEYINEQKETISDLISYTTKVATYNHNTNEITVYGWFSNTTAKHINAFLEFYGFDRRNKQQLTNQNLLK